MLKLKRFISAALALLMLSMSALLCGCSLFGIEDKDGFYMRGDPKPIDYCAYKSDKKVFDLNDVTLTFYFGSDLSRLEEVAETQSYPSFDLRFVDEDKNIYHIRTVNQNFISEEFHAESNYFLLFWVMRTKFNHSEEITIPKELFTKETGFIRFEGYGVNEINHEGDNEKKEECLFGTVIYYRLLDDKVELSDREFDK